MGGEEYEGEKRERTDRNARKMKKQSIENESNEQHDKNGAQSIVRQKTKVKLVRKADVAIQKSSSRDASDHDKGTNRDSERGTGVTRTTKVSSRGASDHDRGASRVSERGTGATTEADMSASPQEATLA